MRFYHVSPAKLSVGEYLKPSVTAKILGVWLSTSIHQSAYWLDALAIGRRPHFDYWTMYEIEVPDDVEVVDCLGHYLFEKPGVVKKACEVLPHRDYDGEVVIKGEAAYNTAKVLRIVPREEYLPFVKEAHKRKEFVVIAEVNGVKIKKREVQLNEQKAINKVDLEFYDLIKLQRRQPEPEFKLIRCVEVYPCNSAKRSRECVRA